MNKYTTPKKFLALLVVPLLICTYLLNYCSKIVTCSIIFTLLTLTVHTIYELFSKKYALISLLMSIIISYIGLWNYNFFIQGHLIKSLVIVSFTSLLISIYLSMKVLGHLNTTYSFSIRHFISLVIASGIDSVVMSLFLLSKLSLDRVISIFLKDLTYKCTNAVGIYTILFLYSYFIMKPKYNIDQCTSHKKQDQL